MHSLNPYLALNEKIRKMGPFEWLVLHEAHGV
jgi:hypothetical protein